MYEETIFDFILQFYFNQSKYLLLRYGFIQSTEFPSDWHFYKIVGGIQVNLPLGVLLYDVNFESLNEITGEDFLLYVGDNY